MFNKSDEKHRQVAKQYFLKKPVLCVSGLEVVIDFMTIKSLLLIVKNE